MLSDFFRVITTDIVGDERVFESVYLFLDEGEVLVDAKATEAELVLSGLRELINGLPYRFGFLMSFTATGALIEVTVSQHLLKRMTIPYVEIPMLEDDAAKDFLRSQLDHFRTTDSKQFGTFYPFCEEAIDYIVEHNTDVTPRNLFKDCKRVFERATRRFGVEPGELINKDLAERILVGYR